jgi:type IV pilus assembly protein PilN
LINVNLLPKHLRRVREPGYWRVIAVLFPLIVLGALAVVQFIYSQTERNLTAQKNDKQEIADDLQQYVDKQAQVQAQLEQVQVLIGIRDQVQQGQIFWTNELVALLELLPAQGDSTRPRIDFQSLTMQASQDTGGDPNRFEGKPVSAEMEVSGNVVSTEVLADFIQSLESSQDFGVVFQSATRDEESGNYTYSLTVGALAGDNSAEESQSQ